jgi:hypothetical protein
MAKILHLLTRPDDDLARTIGHIQQADPANEVEVVDLSAGETDYARLVEKIFAADSIETW